jgi:hypothetical protein
MDEFLTDALTPIAQRVYTLLILTDSSHFRTRTSHLTFPNLRRITMIGTSSRIPRCRVGDFPDSRVWSIGAGPRCLVSLQLTNVNVEWARVPAFDGLQFLSLQSVSALPLEHLQRLIRPSVASLRVVRLDMVYNHDPAYRPELSPLPHLDRLDVLCFSWNTLSSILSLLDPSSEAELHIRVQESPYDLDELPDPALRPALQALRAHAERHGATAWSVKWWSQDLMIRAAQRSANQCSVLSLQLSQPPGPDDPSTFRARDRLEAVPLNLKLKIPRRPEVDGSAKCRSC